MSLKLDSVLACGPTLVSWLNGCKLRVLRLGRLFAFMSVANDLLSEAPSDCNVEGSTASGSRFLCSGCGTSDEQPLVDSECESSSPELIDKVKSLDQGIYSSAMSKAL